MPRGNEANVVALLGDGERRGFGVVIERGLLNQLHLAGVAASAAESGTVRHMVRKRFQRCIAASSGPSRVILATGSAKTEATAYHTSSWA